MANESLPPQACARLGVEEVGGGSDLILNSLLRTWLSLNPPLSSRAFKQLECMTNSRVSWLAGLLIRNQEESDLKRSMGKS